MKNQPWSSSGTRLPGVKRHKPAVIDDHADEQASTPTMPRRIIQATPVV